MSLSFMMAIWFF